MQTSFIRLLIFLNFLGDDDRPVIGGGKRTGWWPEVAASMWHRVLGILGNINDVEDSEVYRRILQHLLNLFSDLEKIRDNRGVCYDNSFTSEPPELMPPLQIFTPWCFQAVIHKSSHLREYKSGILLAAELLAKSFSTRQDIPFQEDQILMFFYVFQIELDMAMNDQENRLDLVAEIITHFRPAGSVLAENLTGISLFLPSLLQACQKMLSSGHKNSDRAVELLGCI